MQKYLDGTFIAHRTASKLLTSRNSEPVTRLAMPIVNPLFNTMPVPNRSSPFTHLPTMRHHVVKLEPVQFARLILLLPDQWETRPRLQADIARTLADNRFQGFVNQYDQAIGNANIDKTCDALEHIKGRILELAVAVDPVLSRVLRTLDNMNPKRKLQDTESPCDLSPKRPRTEHLTPLEPVPSKANITGSPWEQFFRSEDDEGPAVSDLVLSNHIYASVNPRGGTYFHFLDHDVHIVSVPALRLDNFEDFYFFVACMIVYHRLPPAATMPNGMVPFMAPASLRKVFTCLYTNPPLAFEGLVMNLTGKDGQSIPLRLGKKIQHDDAQFGPSTLVVHATSPLWPRKWLVAKFFWRAECSPPTPGEDEYILAARAKATEMGNEGKWVLDHLPEVLHAQALSIGEDDVQGRLERFFMDSTNDKRYHRRSLRVVVQDLLFPLEAIGNVRDLAQVFVDAIQCHKWLYDHPKIIHRDISPLTIMYRVNSQGNVVGVLNDFGLSLYRDALQDGYLLPWPLIGTGTPPTMAIDQTRRTGTQFYRHELEAFFYTLLYEVSSWDIPKPRISPSPQARTKSPYTPPSYICARQASTSPPLTELWFAKDKGQTKLDFFWSPGDYGIGELAPSMKCFEPWLRSSYEMFRAGFYALQKHRAAMERLEDLDDEEVDVEAQLDLFRNLPDFETLGGRVSFEAFMAPMLKLKGLRFRKV